MTQTPSLPAQYAKNSLFSLLLLFWLFCLPLALVIYTPASYQLNCHWNERCAKIDDPERAISDITGFFRHQQALATPWSSKEQRHLAEVRGIYDGVFTLFALVTLLFALDLWCCRRTPSQGARRYRRYALLSLNITAGILFAMLLITPFFNFFWMEVFHPLVFSNELWRTTPQDVSWYLMPKAFFLRIILFLLVTTILLNLLLVRWLPKPLEKIADTRTDC